MKTYLELQTIILPQSDTDDLGEFTVIKAVFMIKIVDSIDGIEKHSLFKKEEKVVDRETLQPDILECCTKVGLYSHKILLPDIWLERDKLKELEKTSLFEIEFTII